MDKSLKSKRILLTGGYGFWGSYVAEELKRAGATKVSIPKFPKTDLRNLGECKSAVRGKDIIIHLAGLVGGIGLNREKPGELFYDNAIMGIQLIEEARKAKVEKCVVIGTICAYPKLTPVPFKDQEIRKSITAYKNFFLRRYSFTKLLVLNFVSQPATFWKKSAMEKIGLFDESEHLVMDYEFWMRIGKLSKMIYVDKYLAGFRSYAANKSTLGFQKQFADEYRVSKQNTKNIFLIFAHKIHAKLICFSYKIIAK